ncbi:MULTISPECIES: ABC transporter permease [unclassified Streptomyces]|uniref:ABC transporter permease n=1 Tax=unclassified Streptomyces TaxID=2593676 RepID=UPI0033D1CF52
MLRDVWLIFGREISHRVRQPAWVVMGLAQPLLFMYFFGPLLTKFVAYTPGFPPGSTWTIFAPSLMLQMVLVGASTVGMSLLAEYRAGVLERFRVTPIRPTALLLGKVLCVVVNVLTQSALIVLLCSVSFGLEVPLFGLIASMLMVALLSAALASASYALALRIRDEESLSALINALLMPLLLLSGTFLPITEGLAPGWLYRLAQLNPIDHVMEATRAYFRGDFTMDSVGMGSFSVLFVSGFALWWGVRTFAREHA